MPPADDDISRRFANEHAKEIIGPTQKMAIEGLANTSINHLAGSGGLVGAGGFADDLVGVPPKRPHPGSGSVPEPAKPGKPVAGPKPPAAVGGAFPGSSRIWGKNRFVKELHDQGFALKGPTHSGDGLIYTNPTTCAEVRIMPRPNRKPYRGEPLEKFEGDFYYRFKPRPGQPWGPHQPLPGE